MRFCDSAKDADLILIADTGSTDDTVKFALKDRNTGCITDPEGKRRYGFSAQNVLAAEGDTPVIVSTEDPNKLQLTSDYMIPVLVNAVNELSQELDALKARLAILESK